MAQVLVVQLMISRVLGSHFICISWFFSKFYIVRSAVHFVNALSYLLHADLHNAVMHCQNNSSSRIAFPWSKITPLSAFRPG